MANECGMGSGGNSRVEKINASAVLLLENRFCRHRFLRALCRADAIPPHFRRLTSHPNATFEPWIHALTYPPVTINKCSRAVCSFAQINTKIVRTVMPLTQFRMHSIAFDQLTTRTLYNCTLKRQPCELDCPKQSHSINSIILLSTQWERRKVRHDDKRRQNK